jgi:glutamate 5-kinase
MAAGARKKSSPRTLRRWVVKAGSNMVCSGGPLLLREWMRQVAALRRDHGIEVVWVTSGAIASAVERTGFAKRSRTLEEKQALSAIGQPLVMDLYGLSLQATGLLGAQILLTYDDLADPGRRRNFQGTVEKLLEWGVTPVLNENDAVATEEIKFGDNDGLSAKVAEVVGAERLIILTDVEGLYDADPRKSPAARLIGYLPEITPSLLETIGGSAGSARGTGGMYSKLRAAFAACENGVEAWLVKGDLPHVLVQVAEDRPVGTRVKAKPRKATMNGAARAGRGTPGKGRAEGTP